MGKGYFKHDLNFFCPVCIWYKIKEKITGRNYNLDMLEYKELNEAERSKKD